jgi:hypothetical protein
MSRMMGLVMGVILIQLFYAASITIYTRAMPEEALDYVTSFSDVANEINLETVSDDVQDSLESQTNVPIVELGALVFYSGNILIDLLLNFAFAIPQMIALLLTGIEMLFDFHTGIAATVQLFATVSVTVFYFFGLIQLLTSVRSGRVI